LAAERTHLTIGTRGSKLALWQSEYIGARVAEITGLPVEMKIIKTTGDKILDVPLAKVGGKGLFTKEIEVELEAGTVDLAVHSMKDVPTALPEGLVIAAMPKRVDPRDAIVSGAGYTLATLPEGGRVGTSSLRRVAQVRALHRIGEGLNHEGVKAHAIKRSIRLAKTSGWSWCSMWPAFSMRAISTCGTAFKRSWCCASVNSPFHH